MNPFKKFQNWFSLAKKDKSRDATAALGTVKNNAPNVRMVLLKYIKSDGFIFFTNLNSEKGKSFLKNKNLSMCFYWELINRQVRINGKGKLISEKDSDIYFSKRPRGSQIGAWASNQSSVIPSDQFLKKRVHFFENKFKDSVIPRPKFWRGILIIPKSFEFWTQGEFRIHKREFYYKKSGSWEKNIIPLSYAAFFILSILKT